MISPISPPSYPLPVSSDSAQGAEDALSCGAVGVCTTLLASVHAETVVEAARTLGFLCSHESGKHEALFDVGQVRGAAWSSGVWWGDHILTTLH